MAKIDQFIAPGDLDLGGVTLTLVPGWHFFLGAYTYQVSSRYENGKGVKTLSRTDVLNKIVLDYENHADLFLLLIF